MTRVPMFLVTALVALALTGCGSSDSSSEDDVLVADFGPILDGKLSIAGTVELPADSQGRVIQVGLAGQSSSAQNLGNTSGSSFRYRLVNVPPDNYRLLMRVDQIDDGQISGPGDFEGYYPGSVAAPVLDFDQAASFDLSASQSGVDFGLGVLP